MKKLLLIPSLFVTLFLINGCEEETPVDYTVQCSNKQLDKGIGERYIDCGGPCEPCGEAPSFYCKVSSLSFVYETPFPGDTAMVQLLGPSIRIYTIDTLENRPMDFMFRPDYINQPMPVSNARWSFRGEAYTKADEDSGLVTITEYDTVHHIISGNFWFYGRRVTGSQRAKVTEGTFQKVRW